MCPWYQNGLYHFIPCFVPESSGSSEYLGPNNLFLGRKAPSRSPGHVLLEMEKLFLAQVLPFPPSSKVNKTHFILRKEK